MSTDPCDAEDYIEGKWEYLCKGHTPYNAMLQGVKMTVEGRGKSKKYRIAHHDKHSVRYWVEDIVKDNLTEPHACERILQ